MRREEEKGSNVGNMSPKVSLCIGASLFIGSAAASLPTPSSFLILRAHLIKDSLSSYKLSPVFLDHLGLNTIKIT